jgi:adenine-specific DNA-methyltransferase
MLVSSTLVYVSELAADAVLGAEAVWSSGILTDGEPFRRGRLPGYEGRLELTWTNKGKRLLAAEDGSYEWVDPSDYRVAEVRLLQNAATVGDVAQERAADNLLIRGDALNALRSLARLPEFAKHYLGKVKLAYLDPPFNTQQTFLHYDDNLEHSVWLTMMRDRLAQIRELLAPGGSVWVHLDDSEVAYCRVMMDEVFGRENFVSTVIWEKTDSPRMDADYFSGRHDTILVYRASDAFRLRRVPNTEIPAHYNRVDVDGRRYYTKPLRAMGGQGSTRVARPTLYFPLTAPDGTEVYPKLQDGSDGAWRWSPARLQRDGHLIEWVQGRSGWVPYFRIYAKEVSDRPAETIWPQSEVGSTRTSAKEVKAITGGRAFATPKPERLLHRIILLASEPGDVVLDPFLGSGTTAAVAHKMDRRWVAIEREAATLETYAIPRLTKVVEGADPGGVTDLTGWGGGGGFRLLDVAPSMFEADDGLVFLADTMTNGRLAEATGAQLGFTFEPDPPFAGRKGRTRLAVIDGVVNEGVVRILVSALDKGERAVICGTGIDPDARAVLRELRPGSTLRKIPAALLAEYRTGQQLHLELAETISTTPKGNGVATEPVGTAEVAARNG